MSEPDSRVVEALRLLRHREWYAAHDALEPAWIESSGLERSFLQGLIHVAVSFVHLERGNARGARSQWHKAVEKLDRLPAHPYDIDVPAWVAAIRAFFATLDLDARAAAQERMRTSPPLPPAVIWPVPPPASDPT